jgi:hypothetical protein
MKSKKLSKIMDVIITTVKDFRLVVNECIKLSVSIYILIGLVLMFCYIGFDLRMVISFLCVNMSYKTVVKLVVSLFQ